ncbi:MAG TPA: hypothetical protein VJW76_01425 [Verrucomicrobiae bacterium]|nr:hypothetical protein [Verrucomicrobiae bacterium]
MNFDNPAVLALASLTVLAAIAGIVSRYFSPEARLGRRRRRNNYRVVSKARRPVVTLNARVKK